MPEIQVQITALLSAIAPNSTPPLQHENGQSATTDDLASCEQLFVVPVIPDVGSCFVFGVMEDAAEDSFLPCRLKPTAALFRDGTMILVWAFAEPLAESEVNAIAGALGMESISDRIPLPSPDWALVHVDAARTYSLADLARVYRDSVDGVDGGATGGPEGASEASSTGPVKYGNADVHSPYNETDYSKEITITVGANRQSKRWEPKSMPAGAFIAKLCCHLEGDKDGPAFVLGDMVRGQRLKTSVKSLWGIGLDIDTGTPSEVVDAALKKLGCMGVRYTTHSHNKTETEIKRDRIIKFAAGRNINDDLIREFLRDVEQWEALIVDETVYVGDGHTEKGIVCQISHPPMPKHRIVLLLAEPFFIANEAPTQAEAMRKWAKVPEALAALLGVPFDTSCTDPSRLFYFPRHAKGAQYEISLFGGPYFDWRTLVLDDPMEKLAADLNRGKSKSQTDAGRELGRWSLKRAHGFQIADVIEARAPDRIRRNTGHGFEIECPFDEDHSNAGDTNDSACLAVNAGESQSEFYVIKCQHEGCRQKTNNDMLAKMLADGWFDESVLEDDQFNAILEDDAKHQRDEVAADNKTDDTRGDWQAQIDALHPESSEKEIDAVARAIVLADLKPLAEARAVDRMADKLGMKVTPVKKTLAGVRKDLAAESPQDTATTDASGRVIFTYQGEFDFHEAVAVCTKALRDKNARDRKPTFSQLTGNAVRLEMQGGRASFVELDRDSLWSELNKLVTFVRRGDGGDGPRQAVHSDVAKHIYEQAYETLVAAPEVFYTPIFLSTGELLLTEGYYFNDKPTAQKPLLNHILTFNGLVVPPVPNPPTEADMQNSLAWIRRELLSDFPFLDYDTEGKETREPSEANALAMLLTPPMRPMIDGRTPLFFVTKPTSGTGGTLLASLPMMLIDGYVAEVRYTSHEEEMGKNLVAVIKGARKTLFFDDVKEFDNQVLVRTLTSPIVGGRELGHSKLYEVPNDFNWTACGNNPKVTPDMRRRMCSIRLNAKTADVAGRVYRHPDTSGMEFEEFVKVNRGLAIQHILTLVTYWQATGKKLFTDRRRSGFEDWSAKVGGVLQACGVEGFLNNSAPVTLDMGQASETEFMREWFKRYGSTPLSASALFEWAQDAALAIITGRSDEDKRANFQNKLPGLDGRAFEYEKKNYYVRAKADAGGGMVFGIELVGETEPNVA
jgi:hypothetical protein